MRFLSDFQTLCLQIGFPFLPPLLVFLRHVQPKGAGRRLRVKLTSLLNIWKIDKKFTTFNVRIIRQITTFSSTIGLTRRRLTNFFWQKLYNFYNQNDSSNYDNFPKNNTKPLWFDDFFGENWFFSAYLANIVFFQVQGETEHSRTMCVFYKYCCLNIPSHAAHDFDSLSFSHLHSVWNSPK